MENDIRRILEATKTSLPHPFLYTCLFMLVSIAAHPLPLHHHNKLPHRLQHFSEAFTGDTAAIHFEPVIVNLQRDWRKQISIKLVEK